MWTFHFKTILGELMRIATWNLESLRKLTAERDLAFQQAMHSVNADVWVLTETWVDYGPRDGFTLIAQSHSADDLEKGSNRCWVSIWVKSNIAANSLKVVGQFDRMAVCCVLPQDSRSVVIVGTVLPWGSDALWPGAAGFCDALAAQETEWATLRSAHGDANLIVAGYFNQSLPHQRYYGFRPTEVALKSALEKHGLGCVTEGNIPSTGVPRIDHICVHKGDCKKTMIGGWPVPCIGEKSITDHHGVYADVNPVSP